MKPPKWAKLFTVSCTVHVCSVHVYLDQENYKSIIKPVTSKLELEENLLPNQLNDPGSSDTSVKDKVVVIWSKPFGASWSFAI